MTQKETVTATANYSQRTFTLRVKDRTGKTIGTYRTIPMSEDEFNEEQYNTSDDWRQFLKTDAYYTVR